MIGRGSCVSRQVTAAHSTGDNSMDASRTAARRTVRDFLAACALATVAAAAPAQDAQPPGARAQAALERLFDPGQISRWLLGRAPGAGEVLGADELSFSVQQCGCYDRPQPHFPYVLVMVSTRLGDLLARTEGNENAVIVKPVAVRRGSRYCDVDEGGACFGDFDHPCEFTDHRFGPQLAPYFPTCKTGD
jgi:hypothetical protein